MEDKRIDYNKISQHASASLRQQAVLQEMERCKDGVLITDCLAHQSQNGLIVMQILDKQSETGINRRYKIRILKDKWGEPVEQGQEIEWMTGKITRDPFGKKITNAYYKDMVRRGKRRSLEIWHSATVDKHGCIDVGFKDAAILLSERGLHFESKEPLCRYRDVSSEPVKCKDGKMRLQHFWLYEEVPPWEYEQLEAAYSAPVEETEIKQIEDKPASKYPPLNPKKDK